MADFTGRKVLVTGASGGIGAATVRRLVGQGATVYAGGQDAAKLSKLADETGAEPVSFDLTSEDEIRTAVSGLDLWGVVNCGGFGGEIATPQDTDIAVFDKVISVNARGSLLVIKHVTPGMIAGGRGGSIVNVSSQASLVALPGHISYGSSKAALDNITRVSALELGRHNIRVNSVNPDRGHDRDVRVLLGTSRCRSAVLGADASGPVGHRGRDRRAHQLPAQ